MSMAFQKLPVYFSATTIAYTFPGCYANWERTSPLMETVFFQPVVDGIQAHQDCAVEITLEIPSALAAQYYIVSVDATTIQCQNSGSFFDADSKTLCVKYVAKILSGNILRVSGQAGYQGHNVPRGTVITLRNLP